MHACFRQIKLSSEIYQETLSAGSCEMQYKFFGFLEHDLQENPHLYIFAFPAHDSSNPHRQVMYY